MLYLRFILMISSIMSVDKFIYEVDNTDVINLHSISNYCRIFSKAFDNSSKCNIAISFLPKQITTIKESYDMN